MNSWDFIPCDVQPQSGYFGAGWELLTHVNQIYQVRELVMGILHTESSSLASATNNVCRKVSKRLKELSSNNIPDRDVTESETQTLQQLLRTMQFPNIQQNGAVLKDGQVCISSLMNAVYGSDSRNGKTVVDVVAFGPMNKAELFKQACSSVLRKCIDASNCFTLMRLGEAVDCHELAEEALLYALSNFSACYQNNSQGFCQLEEKTLLKLLQNRHLRVSSEDETVDAIVTWVNFKQDQRQNILPLLLQTCALDQLETPSLTVLSAHPMVVHDASSLQFVADAYARRCQEGTDETQSTSPVRKPSLVAQKPTGNMISKPSIFASCRT